MLGGLHIISHFRGVPGETVVILFSFEQVGVGVLRTIGDIADGAERRIRLLVLWPSATFSFPLID